MKILIVGDSITEGITGVSYIKKLRLLMPDDEIINLGLGGDTIIGIGNRVLEHLKDKNDYDIIIIEGGHNDILLPFFEHMELPYKMTAFSLKTRGSIPINDPEIFKSTYLSTLKAIHKLSKAKLFVTTLSCINEDQNALTNLKRDLYNKKIVQLVEEFNSASGNPISIIDIASAFNHYLSGSENTDYILENYFRAFIKDAHNNISDEAANELSKERNLNLTIDGVHMNEIGANIYCHMFYKTITAELLWGKASED